MNGLVQNYATRRQRPIVCDVFKSGFDFLANMTPGQYSVILLDIVMPGINGIQTARELRMLDATVGIIFLTSSREYGPESYEVNALYYALKPIRECTLFAHLDHAFDLQKRRAQEGLLIQNKDMIARIPYAEIEYVEVMNKNVFFYLANGEVCEATGTLSAYETQLLKHRCFCKPHRSYIINYEHVRTIENMKIKTIGGAVVPISRNVYATVKKSYMDYLFQKKAPEIEVIV